MADRIKGITIEVDGDVTGLSKALKSVNSDLKTAQNGLNDVNKLLKLDPGNVELLRQKQEYLNDAIGSTEEKLAKEKEALEQMKNSDGFDKNSEQAKALERQIVADEQALKSLQDQAKEFGSVGAQQFKAVGDKVQAVGEKMTSVGTAMTKNVTAPIVGVGALAIKSFQDVDAGLDIVRQKTGATGDEFESMRGIVEGIATTIPTDFETIGNAVGETNTRFHATGQELETLSSDFIKFSEVNQTDVVGTIDNAQKALSAFGLGAESASHLLDTLNATGQQTGAGMDSLLNGLIQNGTAFQEMGLSIDQSVALMGQMEVSGANAETVMNGLRKALKNATEDGIPLNQALADLQTTILGEKDGVDGLTAAYDMFGKSGDQIYAAVKNGTLDFQELSSTVADVSGSVSEVFESTKDPMDDWTTALNSAKIAGSDLGSAMQTAALPILQELTETIKELTAGFRALTPEEQQTIVKAAAVVAAIGPILAVGGKLVTGIGALIKVIPVMGGAMEAVGALVTGTLMPAISGLIAAAAPILAAAAPFIAVGAAIVGAGVLVYKNWDKIKEGAIILAETVSQKWTELKQKSSETWASMKQNISTTWTNIKSTVSNALTTIKSDATAKLDALKNKFTSIFDAVKNTVQTAIDKVKSIMNFQWSLPHLKLPHISISGGFSIHPPSAPHFSISWYKRAYENGVLFKQPTVLGTPYGMKGFGDGAGAEVVLGLNKLRELAGGGGVTNNITIYQTPGESGDALAQKIISKITMMTKRQTVGAL